MRDIAPGLEMLDSNKIAERRGYETSRSRGTRELGISTSLLWTEWSFYESILSREGNKRNYFSWKDEV